MLIRFSGYGRTAAKKGTAVFLLFCTVFCLFSPCARGAELYTVYEEDPEDCGAAAESETADFLALTDEPSLRSDLISQAYACPAYLDVSAYGIPTEQVALLIHYIWYNIPELYHIRGQFAYSEKNGCVRRLRPTYSRDAQTYREEMNGCEAAAARLTAGMEDPMGEAEKAWLLHDRITQYCSYAAQTPADAGADVFLLPGVLLGRSAVCSGYAMAFLYLGRKVGLRTYCCRSGQLDHAWNTVFIGERACHLDITWDDPLWDRAGRVRHDYCLLSSRIFALTHRAADYDMTPDNDFFDNSFPRDEQDCIVWAGGQWYYLRKDSGGVCRILCSPSETLFDSTDDFPVLTFTAEWTVGSAQYGNYYACLSGDGRNVYYNTPEAVYRYSPETRSAKPFFVPETEPGLKIFGFSYDGRILTVDFSDQGNYEGAHYTGRREYEYPDADTCGKDLHTPALVCGTLRCVYCGRALPEEHFPVYSPEKYFHTLYGILFRICLLILRTDITP